MCPACAEGCAVGAAVTARLQGNQLLLDSCRICLSRLCMLVCWCCSAVGCCSWLWRFRAGPLSAVLPMCWCASLVLTRCTCPAVPRCCVPLQDTVEFGSHPAPEVFRVKMQHNSLPTGGLNGHSYTLIPVGNAARTAPTGAAADAAQRMVAA
jgi:hypothetical protein